MKKQKLLCSWIPGLVVLLLIVAGCGQSQNDTSMIRMAQLAGNENLQLKKDLAARDKQIDQLKQELEKAQAQNAELELQHADLYKGLLDMISECQGKLEKYEQATTDANQTDNK